MTPNQMVRAIRTLEDRLDKLEAERTIPLAPIANGKRPYTRKNPNASEAPECQNSQMKN